jgi:hypothetical protein
VSAAGHSVTLRAAVLGSAAVCLVCGLTPYNDYVVANTFLVGSYMPLGMVLVFFVLVVLVNGPLNRLAPQRALRSGELAVVLAMMLCACAIPSQGLMRQLLPLLVAPYYYGSDARFWHAFTGIELPAWLFPITDQQTGWASPIALDFFARVQEGEPVPYGAWIAPLTGWGVFIAAMWTGVIAMVAILRPQWSTNERLPFPLARLQLALIEQPPPGRWLNTLLSARTFWLGACAVFALHSFQGLATYFPRQVPKIPLSFDLSQLLANEPWTYLLPGVKRSTIYFTFIGLTFFIQSRVSFSLWSIFLALQVLVIQQRMMQNEIPAAAWVDQHAGASLAFGGGVLWVGRHHLAAAIRGALGMGGSPAHRPALLAMLGGVAAMLVWLSVVGVQPIVAIAIVGMILLSQLVVARVVAETGLPFVRSYLSLPAMYTNFAASRLDGPDVVIANLTHMIGPHATREAVGTFAQHALEVHASAAPAPRRRSLFALIAWAMLLGYAVAAFSSLWCYYHYATPITPKLNTMINPDALTWWSTGYMVDPVTSWSEGRFAPKPHNPWLHMGIGFGVTSGLYAASMRWVSWPLAPVGYLFSSTWYAETAWFSIMLGWMCKVLIVRFGGADLYRSARPLFVGLVFGEALAAGTWMVVTLILAQLGVDYEAIRLLPT